MFSLKTIDFWTFLEVRRLTRDERTVKSISPMIVCSPIVTRHNSQSLSTNVRRISSFDVRSFVVQSFERIKKILFLASIRSFVSKTSPISLIFSEYFHRCDQISYQKLAVNMLKRHSPVRCSVLNTNQSLMKKHFSFNWISPERTFIHL